MADGRIEGIETLREALARPDSPLVDAEGPVSVLQGTLEVTTSFDNDGVIGTAAGAVFHGNNAAFSNRGRIEGDGVVRTASNSGLLNQGVIAPGFSTGTLTIDGDLSFAALGVAQFELTSLDDFDRLLITDDVRFDGTLDVLNLGYTPEVGDSFKIITFDQRLADSQFVSLTWSGFGPGVVFTATYNANDVTLNVSAVPEPGTWLLMLAGIGVVGQLTRRVRPASSRAGQVG